MTTYTVYVHIPYEGQHDCFFGNMEQLEEWIVGDRYGHSLDDLRIYSNDAPDVYELYARAKKG